MQQLNGAGGVENAIRIFNKAVSGVEVERDRWNLLGIHRYAFRLFHETIPWPIWPFWPWFKLHCTAFSIWSKMYREGLIYVVRGSYFNIASFFKRSQQQHNTPLFLTRSAQLPHPSRVSCSDLFLHGKYTQEKRRERVELGNHKWLAKQVREFAQNKLFGLG